MTADDIHEFQLVLDQTCALLSRSGYVPNATNSALWFRLLAGHDLNAVRDAFDAHMADPDRGRFVPVPADILAKLADRCAAGDGRPGPEQAWSMAVVCRDERVSVVWSDEMRTAWGSASEVMALGDEVGARMAFREVYVREVAAARAVGRPPHWELSEGHDPAGRAVAVAEAEAAGRYVGRPDVLSLPAPRARLELLPPEVVGAAVAALDNLRDLSARLANADDAQPNPQTEAVRLTRGLQEQQAQDVAEFTGEPLLPAEERRRAAQAGLARQAAAWARSDAADPHAPELTDATSAPTVDADKAAANEPVATHLRQSAL